jgi:hypothetical protein
MPVNFFLSPAFIKSPIRFMAQYVVPVVVRITLLLIIVAGIGYGIQWGIQQATTKASTLVVKPTTTHPKLTVTTTLSEDERSLVLLRLVGFLSLLQQQSYGQLYDTWASDALKKPATLQHTRATFLKMGYCSERFLGRLLVYDKSTLTILKVLKPQVNYHILIKVEREKANTVEKIILRPYGLDYRWVGYYIQSSNTDFQACLNTINHPRNPSKNENSR